MWSVRGACRGSLAVDGGSRDQRGKRSAEGRSKGAGMRAEGDAQASAKANRQTGTRRSCCAKRGSSTRGVLFTRQNGCGSPLPDARVCPLLQIGNHRAGANHTVATAPAMYNRMSDRHSNPLGRSSSGQ
jgi:hypothetical protein